MYEVYLPFFQAPGVKVVEKANWGPGWLSLLASVEKKTAIEGGKRKVWIYFRVGSLHSFPFRPIRCRVIIKQLEVGIIG